MLNLMLIMQVVLMQTANYINAKTAYASLTMLIPLIAVLTCSNAKYYC